MAVADSSGFSGPFFPNGSTTTFPFDFFALDTADVAVLLDGLKVSRSQFSVSLNGAGAASGSVVFGTAPKGGRLFVILEPSFASGSDFSRTGAYLPEAVDAEYDASALRDQALRREIGRAIRVPFGEGGVTLPTASTRAGKYLGFDGGGDLVAIDVGATLPPIPTNVLHASDYGVAASAHPNDDRNQQPAIQAVIKLAESLGIRTIQFPDGYLSIWTPLRTFIDDSLADDQSGIPFVISKPITFQSGPNGTTLRRRKHDGSDPAIYAGTQQLAANVTANGQPMPWRGGMFFLKGVPVTTAPPANYQDRPALRLAGTWDIDGGIPQSATAKLGVPILFGSNQPGQSGATPVYYELKGDGSGDGWDITDKGIVAGFNTWCGDLHFEGNIRLGGFRGELIYQGGSGTGSVYQTGVLTLHDTDGDGLNTGPYSAEHGLPTVQLDQVYNFDIYNMFEGVTGQNGRVKMHSERCVSGAIQGGVYNTTDPTMNYYKPSRVVPELVPFCDVDLTFVGQKTGFYPGSWLRGKITCIDSDLLMGNQYVFPDGPYESFLTIDSWADQREVFSAVSLGGQAAGTKRVHDLRLQINCHRTQYAKDHGYFVHYPLNWINSLGPNVWIEDGRGECRAFPFQAGATLGQVPDYLPAFRGNKWDRIRDSNGFDSTRNNFAPDTTYDPAIPESAFYSALRYSSQHTTVSFGAHSATIMLPVTPDKFNIGIEWSIYNGGGGPIIIPPQNNNGGQRLYQALVIPQGMTQDFVWDGFFWNPKAPPPPVVSSLVPFTPATAGAPIAAAGGRSDIYTIPLVGCGVLSHVNVTTNFPMPDYAQLVAIAGVNQVKFYIINNHPTATITGTASFAQACMVGGWV